MVAIMNVSVRELKNKLSYYLDLVQHGQQVMVTSHRKQIATLQSVAEDAGEIRWSSRKPDFKQKWLPHNAETPTLADMVIESRK